MNEKAIKTLEEIAKGDTAASDYDRICAARELLAAERELVRATFQDHPEAEPAQDKADLVEMMESLTWTNRNRETEEEEDHWTDTSILDMAYFFLKVVIALIPAGMFAAMVYLLLYLGLVVSAGMVQ